MCNTNVELQVFSEVSILFSIGGKVYSSEPLTYAYMEDRIFETPRNVSVKLHRRVGRFVKLRLSFANKWILISEITFDSGKYYTTYTFANIFFPFNNNLPINDNY